ncbi:MAG: TonB-dependent receptor plug domain-containing protein [Treponema sp.]|nr:TonB-dependent receptor plug domain-containing protein [Treponema sp.]
MKKIVLSVFALVPFLCSAADLKVYVVDKELDYPLEGTRIILEKNSEVEAFADEEGNAVLSLPDTVSSGSVKASLPGYNDVTVSFEGTDEVLVIPMVITGVMEGSGIVVNRSAPDKTEEKTGVSSVMTKEEMHATANMGLFEDCMSSVRTLPGVSYSGAWGSEPSVRGGEPRELASLMDGMYTIFPYHWGGGTSIFNPSMVDSIKLSNGVFSSKYGLASSGLLEANTLKPDYENFHVNASISTACADAFVQVPFGKDLGGMLFGTHLTYLDPLVWAAKKAGTEGMDSIKRAPYIRDFFLKTSLTPVPELDVSVIGFFGSDGLSMDVDEEIKGIRTKAVMDYDIYQALGGINVKYLYSDSLLLHGLVSYNGMYEDMDVSSVQSGTVKYSKDFVEKFGSVYPGVTEGGSYNLPEMESAFTEDIKSHLVTGRLESEVKFNEKNFLCFGVEEIFEKAKTKDYFDAWTEIPTDTGYLFQRENFITESDNNCIFNTAAFASWTYGNENDFFQSEFGVRGEFISLQNYSQNYGINFIPDVCPRGNITLTPWRDKGPLEKASITAGAGLFTSIPRETMMFKKEMGVKDFQMHSNRALLGVIGADASFSGGIKVKLEGYYKHYLSRIYNYQTADASTGYKDISMVAKSNGKGHVFGFDAMIEKKAGGFWDGYLSYSFTYTRFKNPAGIKSGEYTSSGSPLDEWYYPSYHRFNTLNLVSNLHLGKNWLVTIKGTLATGCPKPENGNVTCYPVELEDETVMQRYTRSSVYSDTLRTQISCPVDVRVARQWKTNNDRTEWELYFALQDVFVNLYSPKGDRSFDQNTGEMSEVPDSADFNMGIPIPSFGIKVKF